MAVNLFVLENAWMADLYASLYALSRLLGSRIWFLLKSRCENQRKAGISPPPKAERKSACIVLR